MSKIIFGYLFILSVFQSCTSTKLTGNLNQIEIKMIRSDAPKKDYSKIEIFIKDKTSKKGIAISNICITDICVLCDSIGRTTCYLLPNKYKFKVKAIGYDIEDYKNFRILSGNDYSIIFYLGNDHIILDEK